MAGANTQSEAPGSQLGKYLDLLHHCYGMAGKNRYDRGPKLDVLRAPGGNGEEGQRIKTRPSGG